jgi:hypothetical protein
VSDSESKRQRLIEKAKHLRALSENDGATEAEALAAARALAHLMQTHRLTEACLGEEEPADLSEVILAKRGRMPSWTYALCVAVAEHFDCVATRLRAHSGQPRRRVTGVGLIGHRDDVFAANAMFGWLSDDVRSAGARHGGREAYKLGFVMGVREQLREAKAQAVGEHQAGALVVRRREAVRDSLKGMRTMAHRPKIDDADVRAGLQAGRAHPLTARLKSNQEGANVEKA